MRSALMVLIVTLAMVNLTGLAQEYRIEKSTIDTGGGTSESANGKYRISSTIGQPDPGPPASGGKYTVEGGFWASAVEVVQMEGAPSLRIVRQGSFAVVLSWDDPQDRFDLQQSVSMAPQPWTNSIGTLTDVDGTKTLIVLIGAPRMFFRLAGKR